MQNPEFSVPDKPTQICLSFMSQCKPGVLGQAAFHVPFSDSCSFLPRSSESFTFSWCMGRRSWGVIARVYPPRPRSDAFHWLVLWSHLEYEGRGSGKCGGCLEMHFPATNPRSEKGAWVLGGQLAISASASLRKRESNLAVQTVTALWPWRKEGSATVFVTEGNFSLCVCEYGHTDR